MLLGSFHIWYSAVKDSEYKKKRQFRVVERAYTLKSDDPVYKVPVCN